MENRGKGREMPRSTGWQEVIGANLRILQGKPLLLPAAPVSVQGADPNSQQNQEIWHTEEAKVWDDRKT